jgi:hypothetical protein
MVQAWIEGSFKTFDPYKTRYLFSSATVLAISSIVGGPHSSGDKGDFELATELLGKLGDAGNFTAMEFYQHIKAVRMDMASVSDMTSGHTQHTTAGASDSPSPVTIPSQGPQCVVPGMTFDDPSLEAFLLQHEPSLGHVDTVLEAGQLDGIYWPDAGVFEGL